MTDNRLSQESFAEGVGERKRLEKALQASEERFLGYRGVERDITQSKRAEAQHSAHLWFLQSMDRISRAMQDTHDLERLLRDVLDATIDIFSCDRAWLLHPCDPQRTTWRADMERMRPPVPAAALVSGRSLRDPFAHGRGASDQRGPVLSVVPAAVLAGAQLDRR